MVMEKKLLFLIFIFLLILGLGATAPKSMVPNRQISISD